MPEGDTIHRAAAALRSALVDQKMVRFEAPRLVGITPRAGRTIESRREPRQAPRGAVGRRRHPAHAHAHERVVAPLPHAARAGSEPHHHLRALDRGRRAGGPCASTPRSSRRTAGPMPAATPASAGSGPISAAPTPTSHRCVELLRAYDDPRRQRRRGAARPAGVLRRRQRVPLRGAVGRAARARSPRSADLPEADAVRLVNVAATLLRANLRRRQPAHAIPGVKGGLAVYGRNGQRCRRCGDTIEARRSGEHARVLYWCPGLPGPLRSPPQPPRRHAVARRADDRPPPGGPQVPRRPALAPHRLTPHRSASADRPRARNPPMHRNTRTGSARAQLLAEVEAQAGPRVVDGADLGVDPAARQQVLAQRVLGDVGGHAARPLRPRHPDRAVRRRRRGQRRPGAAELRARAVKNATTTSSGGRTRASWLGAGRQRTEARREVRGVVTSRRTSCPHRCPTSWATASRSNPPSASIPYSVAIACRTFMFDALYDGYRAATNPATHGADQDDHDDQRREGEVVDDRVGHGQRQGDADQRADDDADDGAERRHDDRLPPHRAAGLALVHADGPHQADLPRPLEHAEGQRDRDAEHGDDDRERQQHGDDRRAAG